MIQPALLNDLTLRRLNMAVAGAGAVVALAAGGLALSLLLENNAAGAARKEQAAAIERDQVAIETISKGAKVPKRTFPGRIDQQLEAFGSALAAACQTEGVTFTTVDNSAEAGVFTTRYTGTTEGKDWKAADARVTIRGRLADIYRVLEKLKGHPVPFEVIAGALDSGPEAQDVRAGLTIAVVVREEKIAGRG